MGIRERRANFQDKKSDAKPQFKKRPNKNFKDKKTRILAEPKPAEIPEPEIPEPQTSKSEIVKTDPERQKEFRVVLAGLSDKNKNENQIKSITDTHKIAPQKIEIGERILISYAQKKHALKVNNVFKNISVEN